MAPSKSALIASSYQHPNGNSLYSQRRQDGIKTLVERGCDFETIAEHPISWARNQDPFGHVMAQTYAHVVAMCFTRLLESWQEYLQDVFPEFMNCHGISAVTTEYMLKARRVAKYLDLFIAGSRIAEVHSDRISVIYSILSVGQGTVIAEVQCSVTFVNHKTGRKANIQHEGGVYSDLHAALLKRCADSDAQSEKWKGKQSRTQKGTSKL